MKKWFVTWNRPEYKEWASPILGGYLLVIIRNEKDYFLCVKAKLNMKEKGLPEFITLEQIHQPNKKDATKQITLWKSKPQI